MNDQANSRDSGSNPDGLRPDRRRLLVIVNPTAGRRRRDLVTATLDQLRARGCELDQRETRAPGDARRWASQADSRDVDLVVVAGGDGTVNEAVQGLAAHDDSQGAAAPPLGLIPLGTANVLAAEIGLAQDPAQISRAVTEGVVVSIPVGRVTSPDENGDGVPHYFVLMAGVGFDAHVVDRVDLGVKRAIGKGAYVWQSLKELCSSRFPTYKVWLDGEAHTASSVIVTSGKYYAGRYVIAPDARLEEPAFHACLFQKAGAWNSIRYALALAQNRLWRLPDVRVLPAHQIRIEGPAGDPIQGDGDIIARLPCEIALLPDALRIVVPV